MKVDLMKTDLIKTALKYASLTKSSFIAALMVSFVAAGCGKEVTKSETAQPQGNQTQSQPQAQTNAPANTPAQNTQTPIKPGPVLVGVGNPPVIQQFPDGPVPSPTDEAGSCEDRIGRARSVLAQIVDATLAYEKNKSTENLAALRKLEKNYAARYELISRDCPDSIDQLEFPSEYQVGGVVIAKLPTPRPAPAPRPVPAPLPRPAPAPMPGPVPVPQPAPAPQQQPRPVNPTFYIQGEGFVGIDNSDWDFIQTHQGFKAGKKHSPVYYGAKVLNDQNLEVTALHVQSDGKILVARRMTANEAGIYRYSLSRLNHNGALDETFGEEALGNPRPESRGTVFSATHRIISIATDPSLSRIATLSRSDKPEDVNTAYVSILDSKGRAVVKTNATHDQSVVAVEMPIGFVPTAISFIGNTDAALISKSILISGTMHWEGRTETALMRYDYYADRLIKLESFGTPLNYPDPISGLACQNPAHIKSEALEPKVGSIVVDRNGRILMAGVMSPVNGAVDRDFITSLDPSAHTVAGFGLAGSTTSLVRSRAQRADAALANYSSQLQTLIIQNPAESKLHLDSIITANNRIIGDELSWEFRHYSKNGAIDTTRGDNNSLGITEQLFPTGSGMALNQDGSIPLSINEIQNGIIVTAGMVRLWDGVERLIIAHYSLYDLRVVTPHGNR